MHTLRFVGFFVAIGVVFWAAKDNAATEWWALPNNDLVLARSLIVLGGLAASAAWLWRLTQLREESADYLTTVTSPANKTSHFAGGGQCRPITWSFVHLAPVANEFVDKRWHGRLTDFDAGSFRGRMRLLEYGVGAWPVQLSALAFAGYFVLQGITLGVLMPHSMRGTVHAMMAFMLLLGLCATPWTKFKNHRPQMVRELMFPITRRQLIDGLFATLARQAAVTWIASCAAALLVVALLPYEATTWTAVGTLLLYATSIQVITFGLGARFAAWSSWQLQVSAMVLWGAFLFGLCIWLIFALPDPWVNVITDIGTVPILLVALLQLCVGLTIIKLAHRRWLNLEIG
jgi:hypothetical protein